MTLNDTVLYIALSIPWGVAGFLAGFTAGCKANLWSITMPTPLIERPIETPSENPAGGSGRKPWYRSSQAWIGAAVAAIGLATAGQWYVSGQDTKHLTECTAAYANGYADALERRTVEAQKVTDGQDKLWMLFQEAMNTAPSQDLRDRFKVQLDSYLEARAKSRQAQIQNPYPEPPRDVC